MGVTDSTKPSPEPKKKRPWVIGMTGGIGSGKTTVASLFRKLGAELIEADAIVHGILERTSVRRKLVSEFGPEIVQRGRVNRMALASRAFRDSRSVNRLNGIIHPLVRREVKRRISHCRKDVLILDAPLLFEVGADQDCDTVVFVHTPREIRLKRVASRGWSRSELGRRERFQWPLRKKKQMSDIIIHNGGSRASLARQVRAVLRDLRKSHL